MVFFSRVLKKQTRGGRADPRFSTCKNRLLSLNLLSQPAEKRVEEAAAEGLFPHLLGRSDRNFRLRALLAFSIQYLILKLA
jgi:hypothetical protein